MRRLLALLLCAAASAGPARAQEEGLGAPFVERFRVIDHDRWRVADGWNNGDWIDTEWRASQMGVFPDGLHVELARTHTGPKPFASGELQSDALYRYGYFETRMQAARGSGLVNGFFTYIRPGEHNTWDEIDIEILGRDTRSIQFTYYRDGVRSEPEVVPLGFDAAAGFHTYGFEWVHGRIRWYVDGALKYQAAGAGIPDVRPQRVFLHMWNAAALSDWVGPILPWEGPFTMRVSCIAQAERYSGRQLCS
jgi:beta-glucanase (GH16 family)